MVGPVDDFSAQVLLLTDGRQADSIADRSPSLISAASKKATRKHATNDPIRLVDDLVDS